MWLSSQAPLEAHGAHRHENGHRQTPSQESRVPGGERGASQGLCSAVQSEGRCPDSWQEDLGLAWCPLSTPGPRDDSEPGLPCP